MVVRPATSAIVSLDVSVVFHDQDDARCYLNFEDGLSVVGSSVYKLSVHYFFLYKTLNQKKSVRCCLFLVSCFLGV